MVKNQIFHHAFRIKYPGIVRHIFTDIHIGLPSILSGGEIKNFILTKGIWDTGATGTVITKSVVNKLNLLPTGKCIAKGINSSAEKNTYLVDIALPNMVLMSNWNVIESEINSPEIDILIGMDIIQQGDFAIANAGKKTTFSYCMPAHKNPIDLYQKSNAVNPKSKK